MRQKINAEVNKVKLELRVSVELKETLVALGKTKGISANKMGTLLVNQTLQREPNLIDAMNNAVALHEVWEKWIFLYSQMSDSYWLLTAADFKSESFLDRCKDFMENAELVYKELGQQQK